MTKVCQLFVRSSGIFTRKAGSTVVSLSSTGTQLAQPFLRGDSLLMWKVLHHMNYMLEDGHASLELSITRPETMFGDVAVAVNPEDRATRTDW